MSSTKSKGPVDGPHVRMREMPRTSNSPAWADVRFATGAQMQVVEATMSTGAGVSPMGRHAHPTEQITYVIAGEVRGHVGEVGFVAGPGDVIIAPSNVEHEIEFVGDVHLIEVFSPPQHPRRWS